MTEALEALEKLTNYKCSSMSEKIECKEIIEKALIALEIIKRYISVKKGFYDQCWIVIGDYSINISKEKYDILKEALNDE